MIIDVEGTPAHRTEEVQSAKTTIDCAERQVHLKPKRLAMFHRLRPPEKT